MADKDNDMREQTLAFKKMMELSTADMRDSDSPSDPVCLPTKGESVAISLSPKTAALCYDRVWSFWEGRVPQPIRCFGGTWTERSLAGFRFDQAMSDPPFGRDSFMHTIDLSAIARTFSFECGLPMVPIYTSTASRDSVYRTGDRRVVVATLADLNIVSENTLTWEQVLEFRKDKDSQFKYKRFLHWLDKEMVGRPQDFIKEEIELRLQDYEHALQKHGIKTIVGTISEALDGKYFLGASSLAGSLILTGHPSLGVLVGSGLVVGKTAVKIAETLLSFDDVQCGPNSEISWVYEAKQLEN